MNDFTIHQTFEILGLHRIQNVKFSNLFVTQLQLGLNRGTVDSQKVVDQIQKIQNEALTAVKGVRQFEKEIVSGFFYSHWFETRFMGLNFINHWKLRSRKSPELKAMIMDTCNKFPALENDRLSKWNLAGEIARNFVNGFHERSKNGKLTGEWIIFAKENGLNVYLTLASHNEDDIDIFLRMAQFTHSYPDEQSESKVHFHSA
jgi:hypothetical protein